jgi:hypothetical protein
MHEPWTTLSGSQGAALTQSVVLARHRLHETDRFGDQALEALLEVHPRENLMALSTGADPTRSEEWRLALVGDADGRDLLDAVRMGRIWLNVLQVDRHHVEMARLRDEIFEEISSVVPDLVRESARLTLLVSSPGAIVYYHLDAGPNLLMHVRGTKKLWVYPALNDWFAPRADVEDIFAGVRIENLPFDPGFDDAATVYDLEPGRLIAWPQNAPHRICNGDSLNVSLAAEFVTVRSLRRQHVWLANRLISRKLHAPCRSVADRGIGAQLKSVGYRVARKARIDRTVPRHEYVAECRIDPSATGGLSPIEHPVAVCY